MPVVEKHPQLFTCYHLYECVINYKNICVPPTDKPRRYLIAAHSERENLANILKACLPVNSQFVVTVQKHAFLSNTVNMSEQPK